MSDQPITDPDRVRDYFQGPVAHDWGLRVAKQMKAMACKDADLARKTGVTPQTIFKLKRGQIIPREHLRVMIALALCCETEELFPAPSRDAILRAVAA